VYLVGGLAKESLPMSRQQRHRLATASLLALATATGVAAQDRGITYTLYGTPGLIEMPSAVADADGQIATTFSFFGGIQRNNFTFQITPRLSGTFRYSRTNDYEGAGEGAFYDRSFDLRYQIAPEGDWRPAIAVGLQDFIGTGLFSSEYLVATKTVSDSVRITAGLGWGRLGSYNGFDNPLGLLGDDFNTRPEYDRSSTGGTPALNTFFRGDAALFAGVEWAINDRFTFKAEYSSDDAYVDLNGDALFDRASPLNFGLTWAPRPGYQLALSYLYGSQVGLTGTILLNPNERLFGSGRDDAPLPVLVRGSDAGAAASWGRLAGLPAGSDLAGNLRTALARDGFELQGVELAGTTARVRYTNTDYRSEAQGLGRVARILTGALPAGIDSFTLEPMQRGIPLTAVTFRRADLEAQEAAVGGSAAILQQAVFTDAGPRAGLIEVAPGHPAFSWGLSPYLGLTVFGGENPVRLDFGVRLSARYEFRPNIVLSGSMRYSLTPRDRPAEEPDDSPLPPVRSNTGFYAADGQPGIERLTLAWYGRPGRDLYSRVTAGYLEPMFGGVSAELLWKPVDSRWALGAELNYVAQRDTDMLFGFGHYDIDPEDADYRVATGHASLYYQFANDFHGQIDVGRYLAGDWGATFALDREFDNGWRVGAYFTLTDVSAEDFGEGSFDKGIRITIPFDFILGQPTRRETSATLSSLARDGGARLDVDGRLYDVVREGHLTDLADGWGRFWR